MIRKLAHLCIVSDQLDVLLEFYTQKLGLIRQFDFRNKDGEIFGYYLGCGDSTFIEIFDRLGKHKQWGSGAPETLKGGNRLNHFCLEVTGLKDLVASLEARGVKLSPIRTGMDQSFQSWTNDPDGNPIELMEYTHASWQLRPPQG